MSLACSLRPWKLGQLSLLLLLLIGWATQLPAAPLKVLVIGGPGLNNLTQSDALLAEMLARKYGWETRFACFYTTQDPAPVWRTPDIDPATLQSGLQTQMQSDILSLLNTWQPDVTIARLPDPTNAAQGADGITADIQNALVTQVQAGMGLVVWAEEHGNVDYTGQPLAGILPATGWGADYTGGELEPSWYWEPTHRLACGLPMDQEVAFLFHQLIGDPDSYTTDVAKASSDSPVGVLRARDTGAGGRVVMLGQMTQTGLQPYYDTTYSALSNRPDWGEIYLRLLERAVLWSKRESSSADCVALSIPPLTGSLSRGVPQVIPISILNQTGAVIGSVDVYAAINSAPAVQIGTLTSIPTGISTQNVTVTIPANASCGYFPLEISLQTAGAVIGSPPATALRYVEATTPVSIALTADHAGAARGQTITLTATVTQNSSPGTNPYLIWSADDYQQREIAVQQDTPLLFSPQTHTFTFTVPYTDTTHYRYVICATAMSGSTILGQATLPVYRAESYALNEGIYEGPWTDIMTMPEALAPSILDLYEDSGSRALHTGMSPLQRWYQEDRNWRGYFEAFGSQEMADWVTAPDPLSMATSDVSSMLTTQGLTDCAAFPVFSLGEEASLTVRLAGGGTANLCDVSSATQVDPTELANLQTGYITYLKSIYAGADDPSKLASLNQEWETAYTDWSQVEMPWQYFNFYYPATRMPAPGVTNFSQAIDQWGYMQSVWQLAYTSHTQALAAAVPVARTLLSAGDFFGTIQDMPDTTPTDKDTGHQFALNWSFFDDLTITQPQFGGYQITGTTMNANWFDFPLQYSPDLTQTRASMYDRGENATRLVTAPVELHAQALPLSEEVVVERPKGTFAPEFYTLTGNIEPSTFAPCNPEGCWAQLLHINGITAGATRTANTKLIVMPLAAQVSTDEITALTTFVQNGGTLVTTCGIAAYDMHGKPYPNYPQADMASLLGITLNKSFTTQNLASWTLSSWPTTPLPTPGTLWSMGRDSIASQQPDVQVLGYYSDSTPALLYRPVGAGRVFFYNGCYYAPYAQAFTDQPFWTEMGQLLKACCDIAGVTPSINLYDGNNQPFDSLDWNVAGAGTQTPGAGDVQYVRVIGSLTPAPTNIVTTFPVSYARDVISGRILPVTPGSGTWTIPITRGPNAAHCVALFPYTPTSMTIAVNNITAGAPLVATINIYQTGGTLVTGRHAVTVAYTCNGATVSQWGEIVAGNGTITLCSSYRDAGAVTVNATD